MSVVCANRFVSSIAFGALLLWAVADAGEQDGITVQDPHYGEVLFYFYQQDYFNALTHLDVSRVQGRVSHHEAEAELLQGGLMLSWGQHVQAGQIFERLLTESPDPSVRNRTWFYLGKVRYQRGYIEEAERAFESISAPLAEELEAERYNLLARIYMDQGRFAKAVSLLANWEGPEIWMVYARYNLGVALVRAGQLDVGAGVLDGLGTMKIRDGTREELLGLRDRANLALGFAYLQADLEGNARPVLQRVRLNGPFSNKALLGAGWAESADNDYRRALAPWLELSSRDKLDSAVQESLLAVPYAFAQLNAEPQAAEYYARALDVFDQEIARLDIAMSNVQDGKLVNALLASDDSSAAGWYWQLAALPDDERTRYLYFAIADHRFHETLKSYRDLLRLDMHLEQWRQKLGSYRDMLDTRELAYAERMPRINSRMAEFDMASMQSQYASLQQATQAARFNHDVVALAPARDQQLWRQLLALEANPAWETAGAAEHRAKQRVLKGLLYWDMEREFKLRAWQQERQLDKLGAELQATAAQYAAVGQATGSIPGTVGNFDQRIALLEPQLKLLKKQLQASLQEHEDFLQSLAVEEMDGQKQRLLTYRAQARFALASIYDRMSASNE
jgi:hypothetical protein